MLGQDLPLSTFGYLPSFADAPANPHHPDGSWRAFAFLIAVPDLVRVREVFPVAGFGWGYRLRGTRPVELFAPTPAGTDVWETWRPLLSELHTRWSFLPGDQGRDGTSK